MSLVTLNMPRLGETMEQGEIVGWLVEIGQRFQRGDAILEVETDKTVVEYPALGAGILAEVLAGDGDLVDVGAPIARIELGDAEDWTVGDQAADAATAETPAPQAVIAPAKPERSETARPRATPVARGLARRAGLDLSNVAGTGRRGRVEARDIEARLSDDDGDTVQISHDIAFVRAGQADGTPVLLIHGFAGDRTTFAVLAKGLARAGCFAVSCDLPGHGATRIEADKTGDLAQNLAEFATARFGRAPFHLVAHSMGAVPAIELARSARMASLTLIAPVGLGQAGNPGFLAGLAAPATIEDVERLLGLMSEKPTALSQSGLSAVFEQLSLGRLVALAKNLGARVLDNRAALGIIAKRVPTRVLLGEKDRILKPVDVFSLPPEVGVHSFAGTGHVPHWEHPRAVLNILTAATGAKPPGPPSGHSGR